MSGSGHLNCPKQNPPTAHKYGISPEVARLVSEAENLPKADYNSLFFELYKRGPWDENEKKNVKNSVVDIWKKEASKVSAPLQGQRGCSGQRGTVDPNPTDPGTREPAGAQNQAEAEVDTGVCSKRLENSVPASEVTLICRGDAIRTTDLLFLDVKKIIAAKTHEPLAGDISIVDIRGNLLFFAYIRRDEVCKFNTAMTGLDKTKMQKGVKIELVREILDRIFEGKTIWGADIKNDWISLGYSNGRPISGISRDIQDYFKDHKNQPIGLGALSEHFLGQNMQESTHSSIVDARLTAVCYRRMITMQKAGMDPFQCEVFLEQRSQGGKRKAVGKWDRKCTCGAAKNPPKKKKGAKNAFSGFGNISLEYWNYD